MGFHGVTRGTAFGWTTSGSRARRRALNERLEANDVGDARSRHPPDSWLAIVASMTVKRIHRGDEMLMIWPTEWAARLSTLAAVEFPV